MCKLKHQRKLRPQKQHKLQQRPPLCPSSTPRPNTPTKNQAENPNETPTEAPTQTPETTQTPTTTTALPQQHPRPNTPTKNQAETTQTPTTTTALPQQHPRPKKNRARRRLRKKCAVSVSEPPVHTAKQIVALETACVSAPENVQVETPTEAPTPEPTQTPTTTTALPQQHPRPKKNRRARRRRWKKCAVSVSEPPVLTETPAATQESEAPTQAPDPASTTGCPTTTPRAAAPISTPAVLEEVVVDSSDSSSTPCGYLYSFEDGEMSVVAGLEGVLVSALFLWAPAFSGAVERPEVSIFIRFERGWRCGGTRSFWRAANSCKNTIL